MSEVAEPQLGEVLAAAATAPVTAGSKLRAAREAAGLHIAALAVSLKIPVKKLEALEADRFDLLPDAVFVRALASSVCRALKMDVAPVLQLLPQSAPPALDADERGINTPFTSAGDMARASIFDQLSRPAVLIALLLCVAALVLLLFPSRDSAKSEPPTATPTVSMPALPVPQQAAVPANEAGLLPLPAPPESQVAGVGLAVPVASAPSPAQLPAAAVSSAPPSLVVSASAAGAAPPATAAGILTISTRGDSWISITDAGRVVQLSRVMRSGESASVTGLAPFTVAIGRADVTDVQVRGRAFDLLPWTRENVARFEVK